MAVELASDLKELADKMSNLTLKQAVDIAAYLKETYGIEPAAGGAVMMAGSAGGAGAAAPAEKEALPKEEAEKLKKALEAAGATVELK